MLFRLVLISILFNISSLTAQEKEEPLTRILFIFDASNSMHGKIKGGAKIHLAQKILSETLDSLESIENLEMALRVYGHQKDIRLGPQDCEDTKLEVSFGNGNNAQAIKNKIQTINPKGTTPIAHSLEFVEQDFPNCPDCRNVVILITDGLEACDGDPCAISRALQSRGVILKPFVIGIGTANFSDEFRCIGDYYDASDAKTFEKVLKVVVNEAINSTTAQVNLLDVNGNVKETDVDFTLYDTNSGTIKYTYIHTMNREDIPDTLTLDPITTYRMVVHTTPTVEIFDIKLTPGEHNIITADTPQGKLELKQRNLKPIHQKNLFCIIKEDGVEETLNVQPFNKIDQYLVGTYDLEILTLPRYYAEDVQIRQSETTTLQLPESGLATFQTKANEKGSGSIYQMDGDEMIWIYNLNSDNPSEILTLLPGHYKVVYRKETAKRTIYSIEKNFQIKSGASTLIRLH